MMAVCSAPCTISLTSLVSLVFLVGALINVAIINARPSNDGSNDIQLPTPYKGNLSEAKARLLTSTWYYIGITYCQSRTGAFKLLRPSHSNGQCKIYINGNKINTIDMAFIEINEKPIQLLEPSSSFINKESSFCGQFGSIYFFDNPLSTNQINEMYSFGVNYMIKPAIVKQSNQSNYWILKNIFNNNNNDGASSIEIEIFQNLMLSYNPLATEISNKLCLNVGSSIYLHGKLQGDTLFHCSIGGSSVAGCKTAVFCGIIDPFLCLIEINYNINECEIGCMNKTHHLQGDINVRINDINEPITNTKTVHTYVGEETGGYDRQGYG